MATSFDPSPLAGRIAAEAEVRDRDLGFGSVVSRNSRERLLNRDGSFNVVRVGLGLLETFAPYHLMLSITWTGFLGVVSLLYLAVNLVFAALFVACGPNALAANAVVTVEALVGLMYQALATGLLFARFARPTASIVFSRHAVIAPYAGIPSLQFRIANRRRRNEIIQLEAQVLYTAFEADDRGGQVRRYRL